MSALWVWLVVAGPAALWAQGTAPARTGSAVPAGAIVAVLFLLVGVLAWRFGPGLAAARRQRRQAQKQRDCRTERLETVVADLERRVCLSPVLAAVRGALLGEGGPNRPAVEAALARHAETAAQSAPWVVEEQYARAGESIRSRAEALAAARQHLPDPAPLAQLTREAERESAALAPAEARLGEMERRVGLGPVPDARSQAARIVRLTDHFSREIHARSLQRFEQQRQALVGALGELEVVWRDAGTGGEDVRHYAHVLADRLTAWRGALAQAAQETQLAGKVTFGPELEDRLDALLRYAAMLHEGRGDRSQAYVEQHLRPVIQGVIRDLLTPLLEEVDTLESPELAALAGRTEQALGAGVGLVAIKPRAGDPLSEEEHEQLEVFDPDADHPSGTVKETVRFGFRWSEEVILKARVRSFL